jgi:hypothetical protein
MIECKSFLKKDKRLRQIVETSFASLQPPPGHQVTARQFLRHSGSFIGKDFRFVVQRSMALMGLTQQNFKNYPKILTLLGFSTAWLSKLIYISSLSRSDLRQYTKLIEDWVHAYHHFVSRHFSLLAKKLKVHLLSHLPWMLTRFGLLSPLSSELGERFNGTVRWAICQTNRHHASRDVATQFAQRAVIRDLVYGSYYFGQSPGVDLLAVGDNPTFRSKVLGEQLRKRWKIRNGVVFASTTGHRLGVITGFGRDGNILVAPLEFLKSDLVFDTYRQSLSSTSLQETELLGQIDLIPGQSESFKCRNKLFWDDFEVIKDGRAALQSFFSLQEML